MSPIRNAGRLSAVGLILLAILAVALSALALLRFRGAPVEGAVTAVPRPTVTLESAAPAESPSPTVSASPTIEPSPEATSIKVVVVGDANSVGEPGETWLGGAAEGLGWGEVVNLSSPGRGFTTAPRTCELNICGDFQETIPLIADEQPDVVITFGGTADSIADLEDPAAAYFEALREALPDAQLVAISPVTSGQGGNWLTLHRRDIAAAAESQGGVFVDVGEVGAGDGGALSADSQAKIARLVVEQLRGQ